jgi:dihydropteroate synthase
MENAPPTPSAQQPAPHPTGDTAHRGVTNSSIFRAKHTLLMGVLNVTPDSFSDGGRYLKPHTAIEHGLRLLDEGADFLDIGGESTRPGAEAVSAEEELARLLPVVKGLLAAGVTRLSIDTMKPEVAAVCLGLGVRVLNDVTGMRNPEMRAVVARYQASVVVMHMRGTPRTMQSNPVYTNVVGEVGAQLAGWAQELRDAGVRDIAIDPGIGFGKTAAHNFELIAGLDQLVALGYPVLVGPSRKSFLGTLPGMSGPDDRLEGTIAAAVICAMKGASVIRVHDVAACAKALRVADAVRAAGVPQSASAPSRV